MIVFSISVIVGGATGSSVCFLMAELVQLGRNKPSITYDFKSP
jgi:hypothetical protein